jgi:hypothetical protein
MKKLLFTLVLLLAAVPTFGQGTPVRPQPDCIIPFQFTAAGTGMEFNNKPRYDATGQFVGGCVTWHFEYANNGFSVVSVEPQGADASGAGGIAGTYATWAPVATGTTLPLTATTQGQATGYRYQPWVRVKATTLTGTGTLTGVLFGYRPLSGQDANSATGALTPPTGTSSTQVQGSQAESSTTIPNPFVIAGRRTTDSFIRVPDVNQFDQFVVAQATLTTAPGDGTLNSVNYAGGSEDNTIAYFRIRQEFQNAANTWDNARGIRDATDSTGAGIQAVGLTAQLDDTSPSAVTENQFANLRMDLKRSLRVDTEGQKVTYSAVAVNFAPVATPTDVCVLPGSASKTIRVTRIMVQGFATTKGSMALQIIKRAAADTAGTSAGLTAVPYDSGDAAASAAPLKYTANPTINSTIGNYDTKSLNFAVAGDESVPYIFETGYRGGAKALVLRGVAEQVAVNLSGAAVPTGGTIGCSFEWTEE